MNRGARFAAVALAGLTAIATSAAARRAEAQTWRTAQLSRAAADSAPLAVSLQYAAGDFSVRAAPNGWLYDAALTYDAERGDPVYRYDAGARALEIALERGTISWPGARERAAELRVALGTAAPLELDIVTGAVAADVDLTGLRVRSLVLETGLSDATVHFDVPNSERMGNVRLVARGSRLRALRLANAGADRVSLHARGAVAVLDLTGRWSGDLEVVLDARVSRIVLRVPESVGIRYRASERFAGSPSGLVRQGDHWVSENDGAAEQHVTVSGSIAFGQLVVERISR